MQKSKYTVIDFLSLTPNKCVVYPRFFRNTTEKNESVEISGCNKIYPENESCMEQLEMFPPDIVVHPKSMQFTTEKKEKKLPIDNKHNFELSQSAQKKLREKVTWLYHYARKKSVKTRKGKQISNFRMNFMTLKLPSIQVHTSDFITKNCLNQFFVEISKKYDFKNYVWRLEYQGNGNLHYHIATDTYIDYFVALWTWNRIINKYGYVDAYSEKFTKMTFESYRNSQEKVEKADFKILHERYAKGVREGWKNPNTVDVKAVFGSNNIAFYISKYMSKNEKEKKGVKLPVCEDNSANSRLWFCSRSLSKIDRLNDIRDVFEVDFFGSLLRAEGVVHKIYDYCCVIYFDFNKLPSITKGIIRKVLELYRQEVHYVPV